MGDAAPLIILLVVIVLWMHLWSIRQRAKVRPRPAAPFDAPRTSGTSDLVTSPAVDGGSPSRTPLVNAVPVADARPAPLLDPHDPLVRHYAEVAAQAEPIAAVVAALPTALSDRIAMRAVIMAAQSELVGIRSALSATNLASQSVLFRQIEQIERQFARVRADAQSIAASYARYTQVFEQLSVGVTTLRQALDELAQQAQLPLVWSFTGPISTQAVRLAKGLPPPEQLTSYDDLKRQMRRAQGLLRDIEAGQGAAATARTQRAALLDLLNSPELAEQPQWHRAVVLLSQRSLALGAAAAAPNAQLAVLRDAADSVLARRQALFAGLAADARGGYQLDEAQLAPLVAEAQAIQQEVRELWQRARSLAASRA